MTTVYLLIVGCRSVGQPGGQVLDDEIFTTVSLWSPILKATQANSKILYIF